MIRRDRSRLAPWSPYPPKSSISINILQATRLAMRQAIGLLALRPDAVVVDAVTLEDVAQRPKRTAAAPPASRS
jgi:ribonuclease HII